MTEKVKFENTPQHISGYITRTNTIVLCGTCHGYGFRKHQDHSKWKETYFQAKCLVCEGDGRLIQSTDNIILSLPNEKVELLPYASFKDVVDPYGEEIRPVVFRLDKTDKELEKQYPELAAVNYDNYDRLVEQYRVVEILKKEEMNG